MKTNLLIHIPHSSIKLPDYFWRKTLLSKKYIHKENIFISDYLVNKFIPKSKCYILKFKYSRLFCDVERFKDNDKEKMANYGMGAIYTLDSNNKLFIKYNTNYKNFVLKRYYDKHHNRFNYLVSKILKYNNYCYILDLHSFSDILVKKLFNYENCPDICIGTESNYLDQDLVDFTVKYFSDNEYTVKLNYPYQGSIIPNKFYKTNSHKIKTIMIEINKRTYLKNNYQIDSIKYTKLKRCMDTYYILLNQYLRRK